MPDETEVTPGVIWDERGVLVDPELDQHFKEQSEIVLGTRAALEDVEPIQISDINAPFVSQQMEGQTRDPLTSPQPNADPNNRPTPLQPMTYQQVEIDEQIRDGAKAITDAEGVDAQGDPAPIPPPIPPPAQIPPAGQHSSSDDDTDDVADDKDE